MSNADYQFLQSRIKGRLILRDLKKGTAFCRQNFSQQRGPAFWTRGISFYLDVKGFELKTNLFDQVCAPKRREWRKRTEGLDTVCVTKAKKEGCRNANFIVAIAHGEGVVMCRQYEGRITAAKFAFIVREEIRRAFSASANSKDKLFSMDVAQDGTQQLQEENQKRWVRQDTAKVTRTKYYREIL